MSRDSAPSILEVEKQYDIDSSYEQRQRFRWVFDDGPIAMVLTGVDLRFLGVNRAFCELLDYDPPELIGRSFTDVTHPDDIEDNLEKARRLFASGRSTTSVNKRYLTKRGDVVYVHVTASAVCDAAGRVTHSIAIVQDVTAQQMARARAARLRGALEERDTLLREIHHRVKNNLQVVSSLLTLQFGHLDDPQMRMLVQESQARISAMALVHEKLYQADDLAHVDLEPYLRDVASAVGHAYTRAGDRIDVTTDVESVSLDLDSAVRCGLIVNELVSNAYKHAFPDRGQGRIAVRLATPGEGMAELVVEDDGVGLPPGLALDRVETLGLQLVHHLSKQLRAAIQVSSAGGTRFSLRFPVRS